jgi:hypothetical protein
VTSYILGLKRSLPGRRAYSQLNTDDLGQSSPFPYLREIAAGPYSASCTPEHIHRRGGILCAGDSVFWTQCAGLVFRHTIDGDY